VGKERGGVWHWELLWTWIGVVVVLVVVVRWGDTIHQSGPSNTVPCLACLGKHEPKRVFYDRLAFNICPIIFMDTVQIWKPKLSVNTRLKHPDNNKIKDVMN